MKTLKCNWAVHCLSTRRFDWQALGSDAIGPTRDLISSVLAASHDYTLITQSRLGIELAEKNGGNVLAKINQRRLPGAAVGTSIGGTQVYREGFGRSLVRSRQIRRDACGRWVLSQ